MQKQLEIFKKIINKNLFVALFGFFIFSIIFAFSAKWLANFKQFLKADVLIQKIILDTRTDFLNDFLTIFTDLGDTKIMTVLTITTTIIFFTKKYYWHSIGILLSVAIAELTSLTLKNIIGRQRPPHELAIVLTDSASFPSGHTIAAVAFYGFLIYFFNKEVEDKSTKNILIVFCTLMIIFAGFARIYLGAHWPSDVLASYILGVIWLIIVIQLIKKTGPLENSDTI